MADAEDKDKAEKVAAARKRYEQLKKQKAKKGGKKGKADKDKDDSKTEDATADQPDDEGGDETAVDQSDEKGTEDPSKLNKNAAKDGDDEDDSTENPSQVRQPSLSLQSRMRSASFRKAGLGTNAGALSSPKTDSKSPSLPPLTGDHESVQEIYRKQAARIEELEKEQKRLEGDLETKSKSLEKTESELEGLRESREQVTELKDKAGKAEESQGEIEKLKAEIASLQRQNQQFQAQKRRQSVASPGQTTSSTDELNLQLATKTNTIESLELELSNVRHTLSTTESRASGLETKLFSAEAETKAADQRLADLKASIESSQSDKASEADAIEAAKQAETRLVLLSSDLSAAQTNASNATSRADALEKKIEALTKLHKDNDTRHQTQAKSRQTELEKVRVETESLRKRLTSMTNENARLRNTGTGGPNGRKDVAGDSGEIEDLEDEQLMTLQNRVRQLEGENFDLRRGVWRDRRREMQPTGDDDMAMNSAGSFDDVDLSGPASIVGGRGRTASASYRAASDAFSNVWNTFRGAAAQGVEASPFSPVNQQTSVGDEDDEDDFAFDEGAFKAAQEEEAKARLERVREVKRSLPGWRGWRVDLVDVRGGAMAGVFDV